MMASNINIFFKLCYQRVLRQNYFIKHCYQDTYVNSLKLAWLLTVGLVLLYNYVLLKGKQKQFYLYFFENNELLKTRNVAYTYK